MIDLIFAFPDSRAVGKVFTGLGFLAVDGNPKRGVEIGAVPVSVVRAPATLDRDGIETKPAVIDPRHMVAVRLGGVMEQSEIIGRSQIDADLKSPSLYDRTKLGAEFKAGTTRIDYVRSRVLTLGGETVELIDPDSWPGDVPARVWQ